jgi:quinol-cytochrome oxidoreductase complex cytochrome b subunit/cytochrome c2
VKDFLDWLDHRTGLQTAVKLFLYEDIPASSGWHQIFGSVAVFLFMVQAFTGVLLSINYAATPGGAYDSLRYILTEVTAGRLMHGLHHWGASMMIVVVVLHMVQVFICGGYKRPREATWAVGVVLLLLTMAYGLTGYLLPWDNRAYWGTVVVTQIAANIPLLGPYLTQLLGSSGDIGVVTFSHFYSVHVLLLPPATTILIAVHVYLVRRHGVAPSVGDDALPPMKFYPRQVAIDTMAIFIAFAILFTMAVAVRVPLDRLANPNDTTFLPRPEWYFLFLFQLLKYFNGPMEVIGTVILPSLAILALLLIPFVDRGRLVRVTQRTFAVSFVALAGLGWGALTFAAIRDTPPASEASTVDFSLPTGWMSSAPADLAAVGYYRTGNCRPCHQLEAMRKPKTADWLVQHFVERKTSLTGPQQTQLAKFLLKLKADETEAYNAAPEFVTAGAMLFQSSHCGSCHQVNGVGNKVGPPLNGVGQHRNQEWLRDHFLDPKKMAPGTVMPAYKFKDDEMRNMINYLSTLE